jgi:cephalosporin-C deacetylase-like acetyl esterase
MTQVVRPHFHLSTRPFSSLLAIALASLVLLQPGRLLSADKAQTQFDASLTRVAEARLDERSSALQQIHTRADAEARTRRFREFILQSIGGLPHERTPLNARMVGTLEEDGFEVQRLIYESLPGFYVAANLYLPKSSQAPFPAVLYTPGHYPVGKFEAWNLAGNMARNGIAVLAYDPIGEGERLQYFDPEAKKSRAGQPTGEHSEASVQIALTGDHISRYFLWDAMRGLDYLQSRQDIDANRIGAFGCSGGGTVTAYLAALDPRIKAAGVACYITSYSALLGSIGPQEAEQSIPGFIGHGFDFPDWIEAAAPLPYAVISTTEDMFPFEGARQSFEEAKRIYGIYGAADRLQWITGPGRHANLRPIHPEIVSFFLKRLRQSDVAPSLVQLDPPPAAQIECTRTGQVSTSFSGETLFSLNRARAQKFSPLHPALRSASDLASFRDQAIREVRTLTGTEVRPGTNTVQVSLIGSSQRNGYVLETVKFASVTGEELVGKLALPSKGGKKPAVLLLEERPSDDVAQEGGEFDRLATSGSIVFAPELPPETKDREAPKSELLGPFYLPSLRAQLVGKTLVGFRIDDAIRCMDWLSSRPDVDPSKITARGSGAMGIVLLNAAALDTRIREVAVDKTLISYRSAVESAMTRNLAQSVIPGVLRHYDLDDLLVAIAPRPVSIISPIDGEGNPVASENAAKALSWVFETDRTLKHPGRVKLISSESDLKSQTGAPHNSANEGSRATENRYELDRRH